MLRQQMGAQLPSGSQVFDLSMACFECDGCLDGVFGGLNFVLDTEEGTEARDRSAGEAALYWTQEDLLGKIDVSMKNSLVVCAAYAEEEGILQRWMHGEKRLVGFGRAVGDTALVATLCDVMVHPSYRRRGVGSTILKHLTRHVDTVWDIIDVGAPVHPRAMPFFESEKAHFGEDDEGSIAMQIQVPVRLVDS